MPTSVMSFINEVDKYLSKGDIAQVLLNTLNSMLSPEFLSFVERKEESLGVLCQLGESRSVKSVFSKDMSEQVFSWVLKHKQLSSLKVGGKEQFLFIPVIDSEGDQNIEHGIVVCQISREDYVQSNEEATTIKLICKIAAYAMTKVLKKDGYEKYIDLEEKIKQELKLTAQLQKSISSKDAGTRILFSVLEDEDSLFNGNIWWIGELGPDINLVLIAQIEPYQSLIKNLSGASSAMIAGYILGEMNSLKTKAEISLAPQEVLRHLNIQMNSVFKSNAVTVNAWYGVFNIGARKVRFANANHPDPFLIGPEQQVSNLVLDSSSEKGKPLGINLDSVYTETTSNISSGSKLVICTRDLLHNAASVGYKYDPTWLPQVLETLGNLPINEMKNSLDSILSENRKGTALKPSRLALLLEIPS